MKIFLLCITILMIVFVITGSAQYNYFPYYNADTSFSFKFSEECCRKVNDSYMLPDHVSSAYRKEFNSEKEDASEYIKSLIRHTILRDSIMSPFIQSTLLKIADANPELKKYTIIVSNWPVINAAYVGGRIIIFYAPLLSRLSNESQLAAVLCHELAHGEMDHVQQGLKKKLDDFYDKEFQKELKKTLKEDFNVQKKIDLLALKFAFGSRYHNRTYEKAADSLGYIFLSKTKYDAKEFASALEMLKHADEPVFNDSIEYSRFFKCSLSNFDFSQIQPYKSSSIFTITKENSAAEDSLRDSLRTHPDCIKRIEYVRELMKIIPPPTGSINDSITFKKVQWAAAMEMIMGFFEYDYNDYSLYNALLYYQHNKDNEFLKSMIILNFYNLYAAMKNHELSDYVSNYSDENSSVLNNFLFLINSLRLQEMSDFTHCFFESNNSSFKENEFAIAVNYCMSKMLDDGKSAIWQDKYKLQYKDGRFTTLLDLNPKTDKKKK